MGLDGGTYITRSDVLRGQSWELNKAENSRSTRGGAVKGVHKKAKLDPKLERYSNKKTESYKFALPLEKAFQAQAQTELSNVLRQYKGLESLKG